jgi:hypothetical protein
MGLRLKLPLSYCNGIVHTLGYCYCGGVANDQKERRAI